MDWMTWYNGLEKPTWTPAPSTIGLIWQILYPIILVTFGFVFVQAVRKKSRWQVALPFAINLVANLIFTPDPVRAAESASGDGGHPDRLGHDHLDVVAVWRHYRWVAVAQLPYFVWVSMATVLQLSITWMNWIRS